jgi:hypothetical protein
MPANFLHVSLALSPLHVNILPYITRRCDFLETSVNLPTPHDGRNREVMENVYEHVSVVEKLCSAV